MAITLVAVSAIQTWTGSSHAITFANTQPGTCLMVCVSSSKGDGQTGPTGWTSLNSDAGPDCNPPVGNLHSYQVLIFPNNPGGITSQTFTSFLGAANHTAVSCEWS